MASITERLIPVRNAARGYGKRRSEVAMVTLVRAINTACEGIDYGAEDFTREDWQRDLVIIALSEARASCEAEMQEELGRRLA